MFLGTGLTSSVTHAAGAPAGGVTASPKSLVVLVKTKDATPEDAASSRRLSVPVMLVSTKSCRLWVTTWGLWRVAAWRTASTPRMHCLTQLRSATDPTLLVKGEGVMSRPTTSWLVFCSVRTRASPRCPALPVTKTFMLVGFLRPLTPAVTGRSEQRELWSGGA